MKTILKIAAAVTVLVLILFVELVPQAEAIYGTRRRTRRRTAVVSYSAGAATASAATAAAARSQQEATAARSASAVPVGTIVQALPAGCTAVTVGGTQYQECGGSFYRAAFQGNNLVYVVVEKPI